MMTTRETHGTMAIPKQATPAKSTYPPRKTSWLVLSLGFFWLAIILMGLFVTFARTSSKKRVQLELNRLQSLNLPTDNQSLDRWFRDRTSTYETATWQEIYFTVKEFPPHEAVDIGLEMDGDADPSNKYLQLMRPVIESIHTTSVRATPTYFPVKFDGFETLLEPLDSVRRVSRLLAMELEQAVDQGDHDRAMRAITSLKRHAAVTDWSLAVIGELVHAALVGSHLEAIQSTLGFDFWTEPEIDLLLRQIDQPMEIKQRWRSTVASERAMALMSSESQLGRDLNSTPSAFVFLPGFPLYYLEFARSWETLADEGLESLVGKADFLETKLRSEKLDVLTQMLLPSIQVMADQYVRLENRRRLTIAALGTKKFQIRNGHWPTQLSDTASAGVDPNIFQLVDGGSLNFEAGASSCQLWSKVPPDRKEAVQIAALFVTIGNAPVGNFLNQESTVE